MATAKKNVASNLPAEVLLALGQYKSSDAVRDDVAPGTYDVDAIVHVKGTLTVGEDFTRQQVNKIDPWSMIAVLLDKVNGVTMEAVAKEAQDLLDNDEGFADHAKDLKKRTDKSVAGLKEATRAPARGNAKVVLEHLNKGGEVEGPSELVEPDRPEAGDGEVQVGRGRSVA